jgi:hypothetical protein
MRTPDHIPDAVQSYVQDVIAEGLATVEILRADAADSIDFEIIPLPDVTLGDALQVQEQCSRAAAELIAKVESGDVTKQIPGYEGYLADQDVNDDAFLAGLNIARADLMGEIIQCALGRIDRGA